MGMKLQAKHIPMEHLLGLIAQLEYLPNLTFHLEVIDKDTANVNLNAWRRIDVTTYDIFALWSGIPPKVILAKLKSLIKQGYLDGCACGCRGDFTLTEKGRLYIEEAPA